MKYKLKKKFETPWSVETLRLVYGIVLEID